ncbi:Transportin-3 [Gryllus bimaculatus]|nr:Transportin-3 [Gryllus bimaculatus]
MSSQVFKMDTPPCLDTVYQAVFTLYHNPDTSEKEKASYWLQALQRSVYSWKVADEMLREKRDLESCYFAAQTMRSKIQYSFLELPQEAHISLRDSLVEHIGQVNDATNTVIVTQLCLALADLALQMSSWQSPVLDLINQFGGKHLGPLLEILTVLPEEVNSRSLRLGANRRNEIILSLGMASGTVIQFLKSCLSNSGDNTQIHIKILRCFTSWISIQAITLADVSENIVIAHAFNVLANHQWRVEEDVLSDGESEVTEVDENYVSFASVIEDDSTATSDCDDSTSLVQDYMEERFNRKWYSQEALPLTSCVVIGSSYLYPMAWLFTTSYTVNLALEDHVFDTVLASIVSTPGVHEAATDCLCALLQCLEDNNNQQSLELQLFTGVMALEESFHLSVAHEDQEKSMNYCRIFTELAESFLEKIVNGSTANEAHYAIKILNLVLTCVGHHDYEVAEITFNLWYRLSEELYQKNSEPLISMFKPYVERLIESLCRHCEMEPDHEGLLEDGEDFADFRVKVSELIKDVVFIVGSSNCFRQMFLSLQQTNVTWHSSEAALFVMQAVAKNILPEENEVVPKVVEAILHLPETTHIAVRYTSVLLLGELCEWIEKHPQSLETILNFLLYCLQQPQLASAAAIALQNICSACQDHMTVHFNGLLQIIQSLDTFRITNEAAIGLLKGVSLILGRMPGDQIQQAMKQICWVQVNPLNHLIENDVKTERGTNSDPVLWFDRLAAVFRHTKPPVDNGAVHPCQPVITEIWPVLSKACNKYQGDIRVMERCCRCLRFAVRCVGKQSAHLLEPLVQQIVMLYQVNQHSCFLYLGSILVDEYGSEPGCVQGLLDMLQAFIAPTMRVLQETNGLKNHPDTVDDLFRLCARFLQRMPVQFLQAATLPCILDCALLACTLDHRDANASVMKFFCDLIHSGRHRQEDEAYEVRQTLVKSLISERGQVLVSNLIHASVLCLHSYMLSDVADVIMELMYTDRAAVSQWLQNALQSLPTQNSGGSVTATQTQLADFHQLLTRAEDSKAITHALRGFARLYR